MHVASPHIADTRPTLIGYLPPLEGIRKTGANYLRNTQFINTGDLVYAYAGAMLTSGRNFNAWNLHMPVEEVNEKFSKVIFFIPCRIAPPPYDEDGYAYEFISNFIERLKIPFFSLSESIQTNSYTYQIDFHKHLSPKVIRYLKIISGKSEFIGTRGIYSAEVLNNLGIKNVIPLGCPSLYLNGPSLPISLLHTPTAPRNIATCYSNYQKNHHSRIQDFIQFVNQQNYHYIEQTFGFIPQAIHYPGKILGSDIRTAEKIYGDLSPILSLLEKGLVHYFTNYTLWKNFLGSMDFAFGARIHGLIAAINSGTPSLFIAHDARTREVCEFFNLPFIGEHEMPKKLTIDFFLSQCDYSSANNNYPAKYQNFSQKLHFHGIGQNIASNGQIIDNWTPEPDPHVLTEEKTKPLHPDDIISLTEQINICSKISDDTFNQLLEIRKISESLYNHRIKRC